MREREQTYFPKQPQDRIIRRPERRGDYGIMRCDCGEEFGYVLDDNAGLYGLDCPRDHCGRCYGLSGQRYIPHADRARAMQDAGERWDEDES